MRNHFIAGFVMLAASVWLVSGLFWKHVAVIAHVL